MQGDGIGELAQMPQLLSGTSPEAEREAAKLFGLIAPELVMHQADRGGVRKAIREMPFATPSLP